MSKISAHIGSRIRMIRKKRGYTIEEFSKIINKSKATLSKYENGSISIDIDTILEIAMALEVEIDYLINYKLSKSNKTLLLKNSYFNSSNLYVYFYDGRKNKISSSLLALSERNTNSNVANVIFYEGVEDFNNYTDCKNIFKGTFTVYDTSSYASVVCQMNPSNRLFFTLTNPREKKLPALGLLMGMSNPPLFAPVAIKCIISRDMLSDSQVIEELTRVTKDERKMFRQYNMFLINSHL